MLPSTEDDADATDWTGEFAAIRRLLKFTSAHKRATQPTRWK